MKKLKLFIFLLFTCVVTASAQQLTQKEKVVFDEIAYHRRKVGEYEKIHKWVVPIRYKIIGDSSKYIINEIDSTFSQLRKLTKLDIQKSNDEDEINFVIVLSTNPEVLSMLSNDFSKFVNGYGGYFYRANQKSEIYKIESLYALSKYKSKADARYAVRRGIIRNLGFFKGTANAPSSVFYKESNQKLKFDAFDSNIITAFYNEKIKPGMTKDEVDPLFQ